jgi:dTDP-4-dehydrorhamnose 3,5-epimerase
MKARATAIDGVVVVETQPVQDARGSFARLFCAEDLAGILDGRAIAQINHSRTSAAGAVRGMHYQRAPHAEMKLVRCLRGRAWDVALDLRVGSPTFLKWHAQELSPSSLCMLVVPEGCAHGFQALEPDTELLYLHTTRYVPGAEGGVRPTDPALAIAWPLPIAQLSARDASHPLVDAKFRGLTA